MWDFPMILVAALASTLYTSDSEMHADCVYALACLRFCIVVPKAGRRPHERSSSTLRCWWLHSWWQFEGDQQ